MSVLRRPTFDYIKDFCRSLAGPDPPDLWAAFEVFFGPQYKTLNSSPPILIHKMADSADIHSRIIVYSPSNSRADIWGLMNRLVCPCCGAEPSFLKRTSIRDSQPVETPKIAFECTRCFWCLSALEVDPPPECYVLPNGRSRAFAYAFPLPEEPNMTYLREKFDEWKMTRQGKAVYPLWLDTERGKAHAAQLAAIVSGKHVQKEDSPDFSMSDVAFHMVWKAKRGVVAKIRRNKTKKVAARAYAAKVQSVILPEA